MGDQNLYELGLTVKQKHATLGHVVLDNTTEVIGLREVTMDFNPGYDNEFPWTFIINGNKHFLRSACWGGQPSFFYGKTA